MQAAFPNEPKESDIVSAIIPIIDIKKKKRHGGQAITKIRKQHGRVTVHDMFLEDNGAEPDRLCLRENKNVLEFSFVDLILDIKKGVRQMLPHDDQANVKTSFVAVVNQMWGFDHTLNYDQLQSICTYCEGRKGHLSTLRHCHAKIAQALLLRELPPSPPLAVQSVKIYSGT